MFVLVTDDSTPNQPPKTPGADPASMVWVDPEDLEPDEGDDTQDPSTGVSHFGLRVFGPFETYEDARLAATVLAIEADYRVIPVDPVATVQRQLQP